MGILRQLTVRIGADTSGLSSGIGQAVATMRAGSTAMAASMDTFGRSLQRTGQSITMSLTLPLLAVSAAAAKTAGDFEASMLRLQAISGASARELAALRQAAMDMGATTKFSGSDAAEALNFMAMAGLRATDSLQALPRVLELAAAAGLDMARSTDIVMNVMAGYGMHVEDLAHVNNVLVYGFNATNTSLEGLAEALKYAGPIARAAGLDFEEATAILGFMGNAGIQASMAGTSLRGALSRLLTPTDQITAAMQAAGLELHYTTDGGVDMIDMLRQLKPHANDAGLMMTIFGQRAGPAIAAVVSQGADAVENLTMDLELNRDAASSVADAYNHGLNGALSSLSSSIESVQLAVGDAGMTGGLTKAANAMADWFRALSEVNPKVLLLAAGFTGVVAAIGPLIVIIGTLARSFAAIFGVLAGPAGLLVALATFAAGFVIFRELEASIRGVEAAMRDTDGPMTRIIELTEKLRTETGALRAETRGLAQDQLRALQTTVATDAARTATAREAANARRSTVYRPGSWADRNLPDFFEESVALREAEERERTSRARLNEAARSVDEAEHAQERSAAFRSAREQYRAARQAQGFSSDAWRAANPGLAGALDRGDPLGEAPERSAGASELDVLDMTNLGGGAGAGRTPPHVARRQEIETLQALATATHASADELERLQQIQDTMNEAANAGEAITREQAAAFVDERAALQNTIDTRTEAAEALDRQTSAQVAFYGGLERTRQHQELLTQAAREGAEAYERMSIALELIAQNPALTLEEAERLAVGIRATDRALEDATTRMRSFSDLWRSVGDAFGNAFENAILKGEKLSDTLKALARDLAAMVLRQQVTGPMANWLGQALGAMFGGAGAGAGAGAAGGAMVTAPSNYAGPYADGGFIPPGKWGITGEEGIEKVYGGRTGVTVQPNQGEGETYIDQRQYHFKGTGAEMQEFKNMVQQLDRSVERRAIGAVQQAQRRGA